MGEKGAPYLSHQSGPLAPQYEYVTFPLVEFPFGEALGLETHTCHPSSLLMTPGTVLIGPSLVALRSGVSVKTGIWGRCPRC